MTQNDSLFQAPNPEMTQNDSLFQASMTQMSQNDSHIEVFSFEMSQNDSFHGLKYPTEHPLSVADEPPATPPSPQNDTPDCDPCAAGHPFATGRLPPGHFLAVSTCFPRRVILFYGGGNPWSSVIDGPAQEPRPNRRFGRLKWHAASQRLAALQVAFYLREPRRD